MTQAIPFLDLHAAYLELKPEIDAAVARVLDSGYYILGPEVEAFEAEFARYCEADHAIGVGNGLDALVLALRALDIGAGDEVLVPSNTFIATWLAVSMVGAVPIPVEPDPRTHNIDCARLEAALTAKTRAVIAVHLYGQPADLTALRAFTTAHGLRLIEDAAQAHGALHLGRRIGAEGDIACWSFYPGKNLGALGDAGCVTTSDAGLAERVRLLRNYGSREKYRHEVQGTNSRLDPLQAAILRVKLAHLDDWNDRRRAIARLYLDRLQDADLVLPEVPQWADPVWHLFVVRHKNRDALRAGLQEAGIGTLVHYPVAPHMQPAYAALAIAPDALPIARQLSDEVMSLPIGPHLGLDAAERVADVVCRLCAR
jgi:dTDP-4-amino-4,6-dideoxygalactose transaminase